MQRWESGCMWWFEPWFLRHNAVEHQISTGGVHPACECTNESCQHCIVAVCARVQMRRGESWHLAQKHPKKSGLKMKKRWKKEQKNKTRLKAGLLLPKEEPLLKNVNAVIFFVRLAYHTLPRPCFLSAENLRYVRRIYLWLLSGTTWGIFWGRLRRSFSATAAGPPDEPATCHMPHSLFQGPRSLADRDFTFIICVSGFSKILARNAPVLKAEYMNTQIMPDLLHTDGWLVSSATATQCWCLPAAAPWWKWAVGGFSSAHPAPGNQWSGSGTCSPCRTCVSGPRGGLSPERWASFLWTR